jgi:LysW-gamma-L-lysine carboxypeptidase
MSDAETLLGLVRQYSPSGAEHSAVDWLCARMKTCGFTDAFIDEAGNAVGVMGSGPRQIVLLGHIDTVPGEIPVRVEDGVLYGRGAVDAKAPLACFVDAVAMLGAVDGWQIIVIGAVGEEKDSNGARYIVERYSPEAAIIGEPNHWDRVALGYKGSAGAEITLRREKGHSARMEATVCEAAVEMWLKIREYSTRYNAGREKIFDQLQVSLLNMDTGGSDFSEWAKCSLGVRLPFDLPPENWYAELSALIHYAEVVPDNAPIAAWKGEKNTPLVRAFIKSIRAARGTPGFVHKTGTADVNTVAPVWKCPCLVYGPGDSSLDHTPNEHISLEEYSSAVNVLKGALQNLLYD